MNTDHINRFFDKILNDAALREKVNAIYERTEAAMSDALAKLSAEVGAPFTAEEFRHESRSQISDDALAAVSGGVEMRPAVDIRTSWGRVVSYKRVPVSPASDQSAQQ